MSIKKILLPVIAIVLSGLPLVTSALSLGDLRASSRQGEPLQAEVNLISFNPETRLEQITARIPPLAMFQRFNLRRDAFLNRIRLTSVETGGGFLIKLASAGVMPAKPVDILLEIEINGERTLKQYRLALPVKRAALAVPVPTNVLGKKIPQRVTFGQQNKAPKRAAPQKQKLAQNTQALPLPVAKPKTQASKPLAQKPVTRQLVSKPVPPKQTFPKQVLARESAGAAQPPLPLVREVQEVYDASAPYIDQDWQSTQHYYQDYQLPTAGHDTVTANAGSAVRQPVYQDDYVSFVTPPALPVATHYTVKRGDTLFKIAARQKPGGVSTDQMLLALYQQNSAQLPTVEKIDKLYVGQRLTLPAPDELRAVSRAQGRKFKQSYLDKHRQRLVKKREAAAEKVRLAAKKAAQSAKAERPLPRSQTQTGTIAAAGNMTGITNPADKQVMVLEGRLRQVKRLLEIEKQQHTTTKQVIKEKNRLIQRKDTMIQDLQIAGVKGNKAQNDRSVFSAAPVQRWNPEVRTVAGTGSAATLAANSTHAKTGTTVERATTMDALGSAAADTPNGLAVSWVETWPRLKKFFASYPILSVLLPVMALLGLFMLLFKPGRRKGSAVQYAAYPNDGASDESFSQPLDQPSQAATTVEPAVDYAFPVSNQTQTHIPPHSSSVQPGPANNEFAPADSDGELTANQALQTPDNRALSMSGHGSKTVVINISAPARINIDMATEGKELDLLRQQTDKLKESLRSLENSSRLLSELNAAN